ncbi:hypothetical protein AMECASPLE_039453, partial [Ameca splendens]
MGPKPPIPSFPQFHLFCSTSASEAAPALCFSELLFPSSICTSLSFCISLHIEYSSPPLSRPCPLSPSSISPPSLQFTHIRVIALPYTQFHQRFTTIHVWHTNKTTQTFPSGGVDLAGHWPLSSGGRHFCHP